MASMTLELLVHVQPHSSSNKLYGLVI